MAEKIVRLRAARNKKGGAGQVDELVLCAPDHSSRTKDGVGDPRALRQAIEARPADGADDVDVEGNAANRLRRRRGDADRRWNRRPLRPQEEATRDREEEQERNDAEDHPTTIQRDFGHVANCGNEAVTSL